MAATAEVLTGLFLDAGLPIDRTTAQALYTGIMTDTNSFRYASMKSGTHRIIADLIANGTSRLPASAVVSMLVAAACAALFEILRIAARIAFRRGRRTRDRKFICSELVDECFRAAGLTFKRADNYISPDDIWRDAVISRLARIH